MALHWPTFLTRTGSAIVFGIIMIAGLLWADLAFVVLILLIQALCLREFIKLAEGIATIDFSYGQKVMLQAFGILSVLLVALSRLDINTFIGFRHAEKALWATLLFFPTLFFLRGALTGKNHLVQSIWGLAGIIYITLPATLLVYIRSIDWVWPLALILMIWCNDTMAYIVGSLIGKTPFSGISPKKTWEGTIGGAVLTVIGAAIWGYVAEKRLIIDAVALSLCASVAGTAGDLLESRLKRMANVKDSGAMMPGHGGALDRFDSLIVATPFAFAYLYIAKEIFL